MTPTSGCEAKTKQTEEAPAKMPDAGFEATGSLFWGCRKHWLEDLRRGGASISSPEDGHGWSGACWCVCVCVEGDVGGSELRDTFRSGWEKRNKDGVLNQELRMETECTE